MNDQLPVDLFHWSVALVPIIVLLVLLVGLRWKAPQAGPIGMFLAALIAEDGKTPTSVRTTAAVHLGQNDGPMITKIELSCEAVVPGLAPDRFAELAQKAKEKCPISRLFAGTEITLKAELKG